MKNFLKRLMIPLRDFVQFLIVPNYIKDYNITPPYKQNFVLLYEERLLATSVDYALQNFRQCLYFHFTPEIWNHAMKRLLNNDAWTSGKLFLEFGTWKGNSINHFLRVFKTGPFMGLIRLRD